MQIILHNPQFALEAKIEGTLTGHETISLVVARADGHGGATGPTSGVVVLDRADVLRILPQLRRFLDLPPSSSMLIEPSPDE